MFLLILPETNPGSDRLRPGKMQVNLLLRSACTIFAEKLQVPVHMVKSMTGFGKGEAALRNKKITVEIRSLNSK